MRARICIALLSLFLASPSSGWCDELIIDLAELDAALGEARAGGDPLQRLLADQVQMALIEAGLQLDQGRLLYRDSVVDQELDGGCSDTTLREMELEVAINAGTAFSFTLNSLAEPIVLASQIDASLDADGEVRRRVGIEVLGSCSRIAQDTFGFQVDGPVRLSVSLTVSLNPEFLSNGIRITPQFALTGELIAYDLDVDVDDSLVAGLLEDYLEEQLGASLNGDALQEILQDAEDDLRQAVVDSWGADNRIYTLPDIGDLQVAQLLDIVTRQASFPILLDYVADNRLQILLALLTGDDELLKQIVASAGACEASGNLLADIVSEPLYTREGDTCVSADLSMPAARDYFTDSRCSSSVAYRPTPYAEFCAQALAPERLGNAVDIDSTTPHWTLTPGTRFDISIVPLAGNHQPFMQRTRYKEVMDCHLEMRIYKRSPHAAGLQPLLALHGGSWKYRSTTFYTLEAQISHLTERNFVVFVPFYRLVDTQDGNRECNGARGEDLIADVADALAWVLEHGADYGAAGPTVTVMGQSAGGHLAGWLAAHRAADIERALLLYPPTDLRDILLQHGRGHYRNTLGVESLESFLGMPLASVDPADLVVADNSFPELVAVDPAAFPRTFMLHGSADDLVPARQSVRLCNALSGSPDTGPAREDGGDPADGSYRTVFACDGRSSYLHVLSEAGHGLDVCIDGVACPAGSDAGQSAARESFLDALEWLAAPQRGAEPMEEPNAAQSAGTGYLIILLLFVGVSARRARLNRSNWASLGAQPLP
jgi:acetyl esterase/lipase